MTAAHHCSSLTHVAVGDDTKIEHFCQQTLTCGTRRTGMQVHLKCKAKIWSSPHSFVFHQPALTHCTYVPAIKIRYTQEHPGRRRRTIAVNILYTFTLVLQCALMTRLQLQTLALTIPR